MGDLSSHHVSDVTLNLGSLFAYNFVASFYTAT